jgi:ribonuclease HII
MLAELAPSHPEFGFDSNAGYPAPVHVAALREHGPTAHHRRSWAYLESLPRWRHLRLPPPRTAAGAPDAPEESEQLGMF